MPKCFLNISNIDKGIHTTVHKYVCTKLLIMQQKTIRGIYNYPWNARWFIIGFASRAAAWKNTC